MRVGNSLHPNSAIGCTRTPALPRKRERECSPARFADLILSAGNPMKIYLAGPDVFLPDAIEIGRRKAAICARHGVSGLYPLDNAVDLSAADASLAIFKGNEAMMDAADAIIANLTPFRGPSADAGTVYELGYMAGRGKLCFAYSNDPAVYAERVARSFDGHEIRWRPSDRR